MERTILACDADIRFERARETQMAHARRHDVRHHLRTGQRLEHGLRRVAETEHAVAAGIVYDGAFQSNYPRTTRGQRHVGVHRVFRIKVDEVRLHARELLGFAKREQFRKFLAQLRMQFHGGVDSFAEFRIFRSETFDDGVRQSLCAGGAAVTAQFFEFGDE